MSATTMDLEPYSSSEYTPETVERALLVLATTGGNAEGAHKRLKEQGVNVPSRTLREWRSDRYPRRYLAACQTYSQQLEEIVVAQTVQGAITAGELQAQAYELLRNELPKMEGKDLAGTVQKLAVAKGIDVDKNLILTGRPNQVTEHRDTDTLIRRLESLKVPSIQGTATEENPPQLLPGSAETNVREASS